MKRDPFRKLNRDLALIGAGAIAAGALIGAAIGVVVDVLVHHHRNSA